VWHGDGVHLHHAIDYIELSVTDVAAAKRFYGEAFGWSFNDYGPDYAGICGPDREIGGFAKVDAVTRGGTLAVLFSDDLLASVAAVERAGGTIVKPPFAFPGGRRFHFTDPSGNELAVWAEA
jgi:predicted enzyme related to lactoylglutathione lyase